MPVPFKIPRVPAKPASSTSKQPSASASSSVKSGRPSLSESKGTMGSAISDTPLELPSAKPKSICPLLSRSWVLTPISPKYLSIIYLSQ